MPHVMPKWYRDHPELVDEKTKITRDDHADLERREFIREAAIVLSTRMAVADAWVVAREMWDCKPGDL